MEEWQFKIVLDRIEELETRAHELWDEAYTNREHDSYQQLTYEATRLHTQAMDTIRQALIDLQ